MDWVCPQTLIIIIIIIIIYYYYYYFLIKLTITTSGPTLCCWTNYINSTSCKVTHPITILVSVSLISKILMKQLLRIDWFHFYFPKKKNQFKFNQFCSIGFTQLWNKYIYVHTTFLRAFSQYPKKKNKQKKQGAWQFGRFGMKKIINLFF